MHLESGSLIPGMFDFANVCKILYWSLLVKSKLPIHLLDTEFCFGGPIWGSILGKSNNFSKTPYIF